MSSTSYSVSKLKYRNLNSFFHWLVLLSGDVSLNSGPTYQDRLNQEPYTLSTSKLIVYCQKLRNLES